MELPKELKTEIWNYCLANDITNIDEFIIGLTKSGFTIHKYGSVPQLETKEKVVEKIIEVPKEIIVEKIVEKIVTNDEGLKELNDKLLEKDNLVIELNKQIEKLKLNQKRDIYNED